MGCADDKLATDASLLLLQSSETFPDDVRWEFRSSRRYSRVRLDPTVGISAGLAPKQRSNLHNFKKRVNPLENTVWAEVSVSVVWLPELPGTHDPKISQIAINEHASWGTWQRQYTIKLNSNWISFWCYAYCSGWYLAMGELWKEINSRVDESDMYHAK